MFERHSAQDRNNVGQIQHDPRADGGRRTVRVTRNGVLIERRLKGVSMTIGVPFAAYQGVALAVEPEPSSGVAAYRLSLAHADPDLEVLLCETKDSGAAAADWKYWSFFLDLPRLASENGEVAPVDGTKGKGIFARRRNAAVAKRRPRFLSRRKPGEPARVAAVFRSDREIICYE